MGLSKVFPNGHTTSNPRRFNVDITSIRWRPNFDKFPRRFRVFIRCKSDCWKIHVVSTYFFRRNFAGRKIHVVSTYFSRCNFDGRKIYVDYTYFFRCNLSGRNMYGILTYFFRHNFDRQKFDIVFGKLQANENIRGGFSCVCNFKQFTFARMFSLNFSSKSPWYLILLPTSYMILLIYYPIDHPVLI